MTKIFEKWLVDRLVEVEDLYVPHEAFRGLIDTAFAIALQNFDLEKDDLFELMVITMKKAIYKEEENGK